MEQTSVNELPAKQSLLIEKWHDAQITSLEFSCYTRALPSAATYGSSLRVVALNVCRTSPLRASQNAAGTTCFTPLSCSTNTAVLVLLRLSWVSPLWYRVAKCSSRTGVALCIRNLFKGAEWHKCRPTIVALHSRGAGTFSHCDVWELEVKLRLV